MRLVINKVWLNLNNSLTTNMLSALLVCVLYIPQVLSWWCCWWGWWGWCHWWWFPLSFPSSSSPSSQFVCLLLLLLRLLLNQVHHFRCDKCVFCIARWMPYSPFLLPFDAYIQAHMDTYASREVAKVDIIRKSVQKAHISLFLVNLCGREIVRGKRQKSSLMKIILWRFQVIIPFSIPSLVYFISTAVYIILFQSLWGRKWRKETPKSRNK